MIAADDELVELASHARAGQYPTMAFFGAVHAVLRDVPDHPLADYYVSLRGHAARPPDAGATGALKDFVHEHRAAIENLLESRLVQTNHVQRSIGLRLGLAWIAARLDPAPVHLLEVGSSAGLLLRQAEYGYVVGGQQFGVVDSPVQIVTEWRSDLPVPDLDAVPALSSVSGIDLNPLDPARPDDRRWLEALVWPEDTHKAELLSAALDLAERHPVSVLAGDAVDLCGEWSRSLPAGEVRVVFHCATRMHVPAERLAAFDDAIDRIGEDGPLYHIAIEGDGIVVTRPDGEVAVPYDVEGHLGWVLPRRAG